MGVRIYCFEVPTTATKVDRTHYSFCFQFRKEEEERVKREEEEKIRLQKEEQAKVRMRKSKKLMDILIREFKGSGVVGGIHFVK